MLSDYIKLLRPAQWIKNVFVLAGAVPSGEMLRADAVWKVSLAFVAFCLASSSSYVINDIVDREQDKLHPTKCTRPLPRGAVSPGAAGVFALLLVTGAAAVSVLFLPLLFQVILASYWVMILAYSLALKKRMILDVILISLGFVLRALGGVAAINVDFSPWLIVCTFTLCLFLGFSKRRCEIAAIGDAEQAVRHRRTLARYTPELLNHLLSITAGVAIMAFLLYTLEPSDPPPPFPKELLLYTTPLVVYGVFRYAMLIESGVRTGPSDIIISDRPFMLTIIVWALLAALVVYKGHEIKRFFAEHGPQREAVERGARAAGVPAAAL